MKRPVVCSSILLLIALVIPVSAQRKSDVTAAPLSPAPYRIGERLTYNVSFSNFISAAHIEIRVVAHGNFFGREGIQLRGHVETNGVVNTALFAINRDYISYVDPATGSPYYVQQVIRESFRAVETAGELNQGSGATGASPTGASLQGIYDSISALYRLRATPLADGSTYNVSVRSGGDDYQAQLKVTGRETIKTVAGTFNAIATELRFANSYKAKVFFGDDERHLPVLATVKVSSGEIRAELAGSEVVVPPGLKPNGTPAVALVTPTAPPLTPPPAAVENSDGLPFKVGEQLNYQVFIGNNPQPAATAAFQVRSRSRYLDRDAFLFGVRAQTNNAAQRVFVANDQITSYVDPKTLLPFRTELNLVEGTRRLNEVLTINQDYGTATSDTNVKIEIPIGTHDYLSFFYLARTFNLTPPKRNAVSILVNNRPTTLFITSLKRETIQLGSQSVPAIQLSLTTDDPQPDKFGLRAWVSDDKRRLPLRLTAITELGPLRADLAIIPVTRN
ncbi:MAG: DUF3108 domain-containing protein [bacterium]